MSGAELKPCPFCGTQPFTHITEIKDGVMNGYIRCNNERTIKENTNYERYE